MNKPDFMFLRDVIIDSSRTTEEKTKALNEVNTLEQLWEISKDIYEAYQRVKGGK